MRIYLFLIVIIYSYSLKGVTEVLTGFENVKFGVAYDSVKILLSAKGVNVNDTRNTSGNIFVQECIFLGHKSVSANFLFNKGIFYSVSLFFDTASVSSFYERLRNDLNNRYVKSQIVIDGPGCVWKFVGSKSNDNETFSNYICLQTIAGSKVKLIFEDGQLANEALFAKWSTYSGLPNAYKINQHETEDFLDNSNLWWTGTGVGNGYRSWIYKGVYYMQVLVNDYSYFYKTKSISSTASNFETEVNLRIVSGDTLKGQGVIVGYGNGNKGLYFLITGGRVGRYVVYQNDVKGHQSVVIGWTPSVAIKNGEFNKLTIRKVGEFYYFFINETFLKARKIFYPLGGRTNFYVGFKSCMGVEDMKITDVVIPKDVCVATLCGDVNL